MAAGRLTLSLVTRPWQAGLARAQSGFKKFGRSITGSIARWTTALLGISTAISAAFNAVELEKTARIYGITTQELIRLKAAAFQAGVPLDEILATMDEMGMRNRGGLFQDFQKNVKETQGAFSSWANIIEGAGKTWESVKDKIVSGMEAISKAALFTGAVILEGFNLRKAKERLREFNAGAVEDQKASTQKLLGIGGAAKARASTQDAQAAGGRVGANLNSLQRIGGFSRRSQNLLLDVQKEQAASLKKIVQNTNPQNATLTR